MKLLLAIDGSAGASVAEDLVAGLPWPEGTTVDVVRVVDAILTTWAYAPVPNLQEPHEQLMTDARDTVDRAVMRLQSHGLDATGFVLQGPEIPAIVDHAAANGTDLVVCGSRGRGHLRSMLLGSVSAGVAARAGCSVLVARQPTVTSAVIAVDGSMSATAATDAVISLPMFGGLPLDLVTVTGQPVGPEDEWQAHVRLTEQLQHAVVDRLRDGGRDPHALLLIGRPASEIIEHVRASGASLVVLGAHDQTSLDKLFLGSTTLEVLTHTHASVLVARAKVARSEGLRETVPAETREERHLVGSGPRG
jgi:nucleotide-binding universal stress UspA family protein